MVNFFKLATFLIFIACYTLIVLYYEKKAKIVWTGIGILLLLMVISPIESLDAINWNVLGIYVGMLFISEILIYSKVPDYLAGMLVSKVKNASMVLLMIAFLSGLISVAIENVAVVLIVAPLALAVSRRLKISPVPVLIAVAISANLQGVATLIGDPPSMLLAGFAKMTFLDFFIFDGKPSLFFAVQIGAIASLVVLYFFFRKHTEKMHDIETIQPISMFPAALIAVLVIALIMTSFYDPNFGYMAGIVTVTLGIVAIAWYYFHKKEDVVPMIKRVDWETGFFLIGVFIMVAALIKVGLIEDMARIIASFTGHNLLLTFTSIVGGSVAMSAFVDNVPFVATMLPVVHRIAELTGVNPTLYYFGMLLGASVGGNITPMGASANIVAMGIAKKEGFKTDFWEFVKMGLPFTIAATLASTAFIYIIFG